MDNEKVIEIVNRIEADFRELVEVTGEGHISAFIINGAFSLNSAATENGQILISFYREGGGIIGSHKECATDSI